MKLPFINRSTRNLKKILGILTFTFVTFQAILPAAYAEDYQTRPLFIPEKSVTQPDIPLPENTSQDPTSRFFGDGSITPAEPTAVLSPLAAGDPSAITAFPKFYNQKPAMGQMVSFDPGDLDWSNQQITQQGPNQFQMNLNLYNSASYGLMYADYDQPATTAFEYVDLLSAAPSGVVLALDNGGTDVTQAIFGIIDADGNSRAVILDGITASSRKWRIQASDIPGVNFEEVTAIYLVAFGRHVGGQLNVQWGDFAYTQTAEADLSAGEPSSLPLSGGFEPQLKAYVSYDPDNFDWSSAQLTTFGNDFAQLNVNLYNSYSEAAAYFDYDNPLTANLETVDFIQNFGSSLFIGLDHGGNSSLTEAFFGVVDENGIRDQVKITGIGETRQYFRIDMSDFEEADLTQIHSFGLYVEGRHVGEKLNIHWGNFSRPGESVQNESDYDFSALTTVSTAQNTPPSLTFDGGSANQTGVGNIALTVADKNTFEYQYNLWQGETAYTEVKIQGTQNNPIRLPSQFTFAARGGENGSAKVIFTDLNQNQLAFEIDLDSVYQNYTLSLNSNPQVPAFDAQNIVSIRVLQDRDRSQQAWADVIKIQMKGLELPPGFIPEQHQALKTQLIQDGLKYFEAGKGIDPVTRLPYDRMYADGTMHPTHKITQPTLTGFYLQMLADFVRGKLAWDGKTKAQALEEIDTVLNSLNDIQEDYGWNGLIPWIDQGQPYDVVGIGDNANLGQSMAVMIGSLELADLTPQERAAADAVTAKAEAFMDRQKPGYLAAVDTPTGLFAGAVYRTSGAPSFYLDRLMTEFRGAIAFVLVRYPEIPETVWNNLVVNKDSDYVTQNGTRITNIQSYEGGAFQYFWPQLRNNERDFIGFRNALTNYFATQTDYASRNNIPGFLSASDLPSDLYAGLVGIPQIAETQEPLIVDLGSTYSLASAFAVNQYTVLDWLKEIKERQPALYGQFGFLDSARSNTDIAQFYLGIDLASTLLALNGAGPEGFEQYLRERGLEREYNRLYDSASQFGLEATSAQPALAPEFPDRSLNVFSRFAVDGTLGGFPYSPTTPYGARFAYNGFTTGFDGRFWELEESYDAQANQLVIYYSVKNAPGKVRIELKDSSVPDQLLFDATVELAGNNTPYQKLVIPLPNNNSLNDVKKIFMIIDQSTGDTQGDFTVHSINFQHFASSHTLEPIGTAVPSGTTVDEPFEVQIASSVPSNTIEFISPKVARLHYDIPQSGDFSAIVLNADPDNDGNGAFDLSVKSKVFFGLASPDVQSVKIEIDDVYGNRAVYYASGIDVQKNYYEFLTALLQGNVDRTQVKRISFVVDQHSIISGNTQGYLDLEIL